jgi:protein-S-isoprenylcysteine O-methyltransferase Ste14
VKDTTVKDTPVKAILNTFVFTVLVPTAVGGWIPLWFRGDSPPTSNLALRFMALLCMATGIVIYLHTAFWGFALRGHGTPAPIAPPKKLVVVGLHRYVRNPMYLGVLLICCLLRRADA